MYGSVPAIIGIFTPFIYQLSGILLSHRVNLSHSKLGLSLLTIISEAILF